MRSEIRDKVERKVKVYLTYDERGHPVLKTTGYETRIEWTELFEGLAGRVVEITIETKS